MLELINNRQMSFCDRLDRRTMLQAGSLGTMGLSLPQLLSKKAEARPGRIETSRVFGKAKRVILLFMWGGPAHQDTWDLKPRVAINRPIDDEVLLGKTTQSPLAPVVLAEMYYLQANPNAHIGMFYADWIHPSEKGTYLAAYCIYSAITGYSPVGLSHPKSISDEDAKALQKAAWKAYQETTAELNK